MIHAHVHARGLTLVELLLALGLLSAVVVVMLSWTSVAASSTGRSAGHMRWEQSARATLQRIAEDLASGDFEDSNDADANVSMIEIGHESLSVSTRTTDGKRGTQDYRLQDETLHLQQAVLLEHVARFTIELDVEDSILSITVVHAETHRSVGRSYRLQ